MKRFIVPAFSAAVIIIFLAATSLIAATKPHSGVKVPKVQTPKVSQMQEQLPAVGSLENLKSLLANAQNSMSYNYIHKGKFTNADLAFKEATLGSAPGSQSAAMKSAEGSAGYSQTNVQVQDVDEADIVKTDGKYIYQVNNRRVVVVEAYPAGQMRIVSTVKFADDKFYPFEMYIDEKHLVVIGSSYFTVPLPQTQAPAPLKPESRVKPEIYPPYQHENTIKAVIYNISDKANIKKLREAELAGQYVSSRKVGSALYLVANKYIDYYRIMEGNTAPPAPAYRDSAGEGKFVGMSYQDIRYFPGSVAPNYLMVAGLNLDRPDKEMEVSTYLGSGENIYASQQNLYIAVTRYETAGIKPAQSDSAVQIAPPRSDSAVQILPPQPGTAVYKFALDQGRTEYLGKGEVPGTVLNQFSMDEDKGFFRIATNKGDNNVYILDRALKITGKIENIAPGEKIYSVRFMGDRGYMVTFKQVDPLFVIDLKNPQAPKILGALKIPGYSDYLHPYDENHIIGFGKDTVDSFYQGMKIAVFDVSDVTRPVEKFKELIGDRGTDSELLRNHKALLFAGDKNLLAFPVTVMEVRDKQTGPAEIPQYGEFTFQGAYVYNLDLVNGFSLKGKITHRPGEDRLISGKGRPDGDKNVERILYIGDTLYTLSKGMIKAHDLSGLQEKNSLSIAQ